MTTFFKQCVNDEDFAKVSLFILERRHDLHPSFTTLDMVELLYMYLTQGYLHQGAQADNRIIGASAYFHGTPEREFTDKEVALIDMVILDKTYRGTRLFIHSLKYMVGWIMDEHPEVDELRFAALSENTYLCKLYSKFAKSSYTRDGKIGQETVFFENINKIGTILKKFDPL